MLTMLKRLDKIRFRGPRSRDDFPDLGESPPASDTECNDDVPPKPRAASRDTEDVLRDPVSGCSSSSYHKTLCNSLLFFLFSWLKSKEMLFLLQPMGVKLLSFIMEHFLSRGKTCSFTRGMLFLSLKDKKKKN